MALEREAVLVLTGHLVLGGDIFGGHAHVDHIEGIVQGTDHHVDGLAVAHAGAPAGRRQQVGAAAHRFGAAANGSVGVAQQDALGGRNDGLQAAAAQAVDVHRGHTLGQAAVERCHPREVHVARLGIDHMAEGHMPDAIGRNAGTRHSGAHDGGGELGGRDVLQTSAKGTDRGPDRADDDDFTHGRAPWVDGKPRLSVSFAGYHRDKCQRRHHANRSSVWS